MPLGRKIQIKNLRKIANHIGIALFLYTAAAYVSSALFNVAAVWFVNSFTNMSAHDVLNSSAFRWLSVLMCQDLVAVLVFALAAKTKKPIYKPDMKKKKIGLKSACAIFIMCIAVMQTGSYISAFLSQMVQNIRGVALENDLNTLVMQSNVLTVVIMAVIIGPITEEFIYRKFIINRMRPYGERFAVVFSALLFALAHGNFYQVFYSFGVGLIFGYLYVKTDNIKINIVYHMAVNFMGSVIPILFLKSDSVLNFTFGAGMIFYSLYLILMFFCTCVGIFLVFLHVGKISFSKMPFDTLALSDKLTASVFNVGMILEFVTFALSFILSF